MEEALGMCAQASSFQPSGLLSDGFHSTDWLWDELTFMLFVMNTSSSRSFAVFLKRLTHVTFHAAILTSFNASNSCSLVLLSSSKRRDQIFAQQLSVLLAFALSQLIE
jgi:hypothetical protein